jgi:hypothetical protein
MGKVPQFRKGYAYLCLTIILQVHDQTESPAMNAPSDLSMKTDDVLQVELQVFRREHRDLDDAIHALQERGTADQLTLKRLKKRKLKLKDIIAVIEDRLTPDIIA